MMSFVPVARGDGTVVPPECDMAIGRRREWGV